MEASERIVRLGTGSVSGYAVNQELESEQIENPRVTMGRSRREDENTVFKELVPMLACLNPTGTGFCGS